VCLLVYKAEIELAPSYIKVMCATHNRRYTRSALRGDLIVPRIRRQLGNQNSQKLSVAGPTAWNSLLLNIRNAPSPSTFKNLLKTYLFTYNL